MLKKISVEFLNDPDTTIDLLNNRVYNTRMGISFDNVVLRKSDFERWMKAKEDEERKKKH